MSRTKARETFAWGNVKRELQAAGITLLSAGLELELGRAPRLALAVLDVFLGGQRSAVVAREVHGDDVAVHGFVVTQGHVGREVRVGVNHADHFGERVVAAVDRVRGRDREPGLTRER